ncbi:MAG: YdcF family protein, partial [Nitrososphaeraceae archaeon]
MFHVDDWLVVDNNPGQSDVIVVLGGGGASRLRKGISLYDQGISDSLLLVDDKVSAWTHITAHLCPDCHLEGKNVDILSGSTSTFTDARLVKEFCLLHRRKSILVVTDPYHTRRVLLIFRDYFTGSSILLTVVSSGDYGFLLPPGNDWWTDRQTLKTILLELTKSLYVLG